MCTSERSRPPLSRPPRSDSLVGPMSSGPSQCVKDLQAELLAVRDKPPGQTVKLKAADIDTLCKEARAIFLSQPALLELDGPINIVGACFRRIRSIS